MIVIVCPGQGSQTPGFLEPWIEDPGNRALLESLSESAQTNLIKHGTTSDADTIRDTAVAQPLIVAAGLLTLNSLSQTGHLDKVQGIAGHSVGEFTAAAGAGVLSYHDAVSIVQARGKAMADAASKVSTGMSAVIGGDQADVLSHIGSFGIEPANFNGAGQIVVAGEISSLEQLGQNPPAGSRVIPLQVAGAFHTHFMNSAVENVRKATRDIQVSHPTKTLWTNKDGSVVNDGNAFLDLLVGQVASPVRWDLCMAGFEQAHVKGIIELLPGGALVGLAKRALKGIPTVAIKSPEDLIEAHQLIDSVA